MKNLLFVIGLLVTFFVTATPTGTVVLYRNSTSKFDKYTVRAFFGIQKADTIPAGEAVYYTTDDISFVVIKSRIENYAGWPAASLKLNLVENDTTYIRVDFKKDAFGNPMLLLVVTPGTEAKGQLLSIPFKRSITNLQVPLEVDGKKVARYSGTGFLISQQGYILTNYHVIEHGNEIRVRNINGQKDIPYRAKIIMKDEKNDLAVLKLIDTTIQFEPVPFNIKNSVADLGEKIEIFGYPLTTTMGDDVKLTNGIISSVNGFKGESNSYQLSAPVQPGNSGGPVFDEKGNLVAVVNAKHLLAENATYAIKSTYVLSMLQNIPQIKTEVPAVELWKLTLTEQAKILQKLVYIVELD